MFSSTVVFVLYSFIPVVLSCIRTYNEDKETEAMTPWTPPPKTTPTTVYPNLCAGCEKPMLSTPNNHCGIISENYPILDANATFEEENGVCVFKVSCYDGAYNYILNGGECLVAFAEFVTMQCLDGKVFFNGGPPYMGELTHIACQEKENEEGDENGPVTTRRLLI